MRIVSQKIRVEVFSYRELKPTTKELFREAVDIRPNAQAPYSNFKVGCALRTKAGRIFSGVNVERNTWTQTTHAEQNAVDTMVAECGSVSIAEVVIIGAPVNQTIHWPPPRHLRSRPIRKLRHVSEVCPSCGHCLQIFIENSFDKDGYYDSTISLWECNLSAGEFYRTTIGDAVPMPFLPQLLGVNYVKILESKNRK